jgi:hypothetical protein
MPCWAIFESVLAEPRAELIVERYAKDPTKFRMILNRRPFAVVASKSDALPGLQGLGNAQGLGYEHEQEILLTRPRWPRRAGGSHEHEIRVCLAPAANRSELDAIQHLLAHLNDRGLVPPSHPQRLPL